MARPQARRWVFILAVSAILLLAAQAPLPAYAWWGGGHKLCTAAACAKLPAEMPEFFRKSAAALAELAQDPDQWKDPATPHLRAREKPEHFIDLEFLESTPIPPSREEMRRYCLDKKLDPSKVGELPYAIQEGYERLSLAFRDFRRNPERPGAREKILVFASWLAHYCEDAGMPLHTTRNYDGRPDAEGKVQQAGIHARIDSYPERHLSAQAVAEGLKPEAAADVWPVILRTLESSRRLVDRCYELDAAGAFEAAPEKAHDLMLERARVSAKLTLDLWCSAWENSAALAAAPEKPAPQ